MFQHWLLTLTSSGARRAASLTLTGATSSMVMAGRFDTTLISGTGWKRDNTLNKSEMFLTQSISTMNLLKHNI